MTLIPKFAPTKDEHDAHVAKTGRPYTSDPIHKHVDKTDSPAEAVSLLDIYLKGEAGE